MKPLRLPWKGRDVPYAMLDVIRGCNCVCKTDRLVCWIGRPGTVEFGCYAVVDTLLVGDGCFVAAGVFYNVCNYYGVEASVSTVLKCSVRVFNGDGRAAFGEGESLCLKAC